MNTENFSFETRLKNIELVKKEKFDLLVIGGGITGAGIVRDASMRGLKAALIEKDDFASGASSKSARLVHGGLRYLEQFNFPLVIESCAERYTLCTIAPFLVRPLPFIFPVYNTDKHGVLMIGAGMWLYDILSLFRNYKPHKYLSAAKLQHLEPSLLPERLKGGFFYYDCITNDARLTLETIKSADKQGAVIANYVKLTDLIKVNGQIKGVVAEDMLTGDEIKISASLVGNAAGPWADVVRHIDDKNLPSLLRPTKGIHIIVEKKKIKNNNAIGLVSKKDGRPIYVLPYGEYAIIGTTDTDCEEDIDNLCATAEDVRYLLEAITTYFPKCSINNNDIVSTFAGLRPLIKDTHLNPSKVARDHKIETTDSGLITIVGGKLTTYRKMAEDFLRRFVSISKDGKKLKSCRTHKISLYENKYPYSVKDFTPLVNKVCDTYDITRSKARTLLETYGADFNCLLNLINNDNSLTEIIADNPETLLAEIDYAIDFEMAITINDIMMRRTEIFLKGKEQGLDIVDNVAKFAGSKMGWIEDRTAREIQRYKMAVALSRKYKVM